jgi:hypothetical protein
MRTLIVAGILLLLTTTAVVGQQPTSRSQVPDSAMMAQMAGMFNQMGPMYESMMQAMVEGTIKAFEKPETVERLARFSRSYYDALMKQGFTKEEALQIVAGAGIAGVRAGR